MGELILCSHPIAAMPYYIDNISLNVYSLEELCYYIENHLYLIEADFMSEELCLWIQKTRYAISVLCCWICRINLYLNVRRSGQTVTWRVKSM